MNLYIHIYSFFRPSICFIVNVNNLLGCLILICSFTLLHTYIVTVNLCTSSYIVLELSQVFKQINKCIFLIYYGGTYIYTDIGIA